MNSAKQRYFDKKYNEAPMIECACGCGEKIKSMDRYARPKTYVSGHNRRRYTGKDASRQAAQARWAKNNPDKVRDGKRNFYRKRKLQAMELLGNSCSMCGTTYDGSNAPIFEFHHPDPSIKEAGVTRLLSNRSWDQVVAEVERCVLVCANCHNQHHGGVW